MLLTAKEPENGAVEKLEWGHETKRRCFCLRLKYRRFLEEGLMMSKRLSEHFELKLRIPAKVNAIPVGSRTAFRSEGEQPSERSDAGTTIVQKVFGFVK